MSKSKRLKAVNPIATRAEFIALLDGIAQSQIQRDKIALKRDAKIAELSEEAGKQLTPIEAELKANVLRAEKYAITHRAELFPTDKKSAETALTTYGFRTGQPTLCPLNSKWTWTGVGVAILSKIAQLGTIIDTAFQRKDTAALESARDTLAKYEACVVKKVDVIKDAIKTQLNDEQRAAIGTRIEQKEAFFIEPKRDVPEQRMTGTAQEVAA